MDVLSPFLNNGFMIENFNRSGNTPVEIDLLQINTVHLQLTQLIHS